MGNLNHARISEFEANKVKESEQLRTLITNKFNLHDKNHMSALKEYINKFECTANQHYLFQSLCVGFQDWRLIVGAALAAVFVVPYSLTFYYMLLNASGWLLERFSLDRFHNQLAEMKQIYKWCFKDSSSANTDTLLADPEIQCLIKLIAPFTSTDFMIAWSKETTGNQEKGVVGRTVEVFGNAVSSTYNAASSLYSWFNSSNKPQVINRPTMDVHTIKVAVETRSFDVDTISGFKQAMSYFALNPEFRKILSTELKQAEKIVPGPVKAYFTSESHTA